MVDKHPKRTHQINQFRRGTSISPSARDRHEGARWAVGRAAAGRDVARWLAIRVGTVYFVELGASGRGARVAVLRMAASRSTG